MNAPTTEPYPVVPLGNHERSSFFCGVPELDRYLILHASQDAKRKVAAPFVMIGEANQIVGYYTLSAYGIHAAELPSDVVKKLPKYPLLPATLLGRFAIHKEYQGRKLARFLLMDALYRSWKNTSEVASIGVVAEAIDERAREFYLHHEFIPLTENPGKLFIAMRTIQIAFA